MDITIAGEKGTISEERHRGAFVKPCPSCGKVAGEEFTTDPPLLDHRYWWRCQCGNIWALSDLGLRSVPDASPQTLSALKALGG